MEQGGKRGTPLSLEELQLQLYHPPPLDSPLFRDNNNNAASELPSYVPWTVQQSQEGGATTSDEVLSSPHYPHASYLELRRQQNVAWAGDRLIKGKEQFYVSPTKADQFFQEGLDLVPDHLELLLAQAKLWIQKRHRPHAAQLQLQKLLSLDPNHKEAKQLLERMQLAESAKRSLDLPNKRLPQTRESSSAYQSVLMERNLALLDTTTTTNLLDDEEKEEEEESSSRHHKESKKKKKKHKSKKKYRKKRDKKKRRKRRRHDSSDDNDNDSVSSSEDSNDESEHDKDRRHRHRRKRQRGRHDSDESDSSERRHNPSASPALANGGGATPNGKVTKNEDDESDRDDLRYSSKRHHKRKRSSHKKSKHKKRRREDDSSDASTLSKATAKDEEKGRTPPD